MNVYRITDDEGTTTLVTAVSLVEALTAWAENERKKNDDIPDEEWEGYEPVEIVKESHFCDVLFHNMAPLEMLDADREVEGSGDDATGETDAG